VINPSTRSFSTSRSQPAHRDHAVTSSPPPEDEMDSMIAFMGEMAWNGFLWGFSN
jgi:hypothetical protein